MPIFRVKSVKIYTGQKNLHEYIRGVHDKYQVWLFWTKKRFKNESKHPKMMVHYNKIISEKHSPYCQWGRSTKTHVPIVIHL